MAGSGCRSGSKSTARPESNSEGSNKEEKTKYRGGERDPRLSEKLGRAGVQVRMLKQWRKSWLTRRLQGAIAGGLNRAYTRVKVDPDAYLQRVRQAHQLSIQSWREMFFVPQETIDDIASQTVHAAMKFAALQGAGLGMGGMLTVVPDLGILSVTTIRMIQKLSLLHGFTYSTDGEIARLWIAAATAAGVDLGRELIEKEAIERFVPRVVQRIAAQMSCEVVEKCSARLIPIVSGALGGALNYYFVREWGRRARRHFREKHRQIRT